jgi:hypothetical protein
MPRGTLLSVLQPGGQDVDDEEVDGLPSPKNKDRPLQRLAAAIVLQAVVDYQGSKDRRLWLNARSFLYPSDPAGQEHLRRLTEHWDRNWLRRGLDRLRSSTLEPTGCSVHQQGTSRRLAKQRAWRANEELSRRPGQDPTTTVQTVGDREGRCL